MGQPHKHAKLIKAWADGAEIQDRYAGDLWCDSGPHPCWIKEKEYRIKPNTIKYRNYLWQDPWDKPLKHVGVSYKEDTQNQNNFIRWIGDWQEVVVD